jgi:hypothetical protein
VSVPTLLSNDNQQPLFMSAPSTSPRARIPVNDDILDRILAFSPTYQDLVAIVLSSKSFYNVYKLRPHSLVRKVAWNIAGDALPAALRFVRWSSQDGYEGGETLENDGLDMEPIITKDEIIELKRWAGVAEGLEKIFSNRLAFPVKY